MKGVGDRPGRPLQAIAAVPLREYRPATAGPGAVASASAGTVPGLAGRAREQRAAESSMAPRAKVLGKRPHADSAVVPAGIARAKTEAPARGDHVKISAAEIAHIIGLKAADRENRSLRSIVMGQGGSTYKNVSKYIDAHGALRDPQVVTKFADYDQHKASIEASLRKLGHPLPQEGPAAEGGASHERKTLTAQGVHDSLVQRIESGKHVSNASMQRWARATTWKKERLAERLSKMPDYADYQHRIEPLLKQLKILGPDESLPEPAEKVLDFFDAEKLASALRLTLERRQAKAEGRTKRNDPSLAKPLHEEVGMSSRLTLSSWMLADGSLNKSLGIVSRLPKYDDWQEEIKELLRALGHHKTADDLPKVAQRKKDMQASVIARALEWIAEDRSRLPRVFASQLGVSGMSLVEYIGSDGAHFDFDRIAALADYATHFESIRGSLQRMGRGDVAASLREPPAQVLLPSGEAVQARMSVSAFLGRAEAHLDQIADVAKLLRDNPGMDMDTAANLIGASKPTVRILLDGRGAVRDARSIEGHFDGMDSASSARLPQLLDRLSRRLEGSEAAPAAAGGPMKTMLLKGYSVSKLQPSAVVASRADGPRAGTGQPQPAVTVAEPGAGGSQEIDDIPTGIALTEQDEDDAPQPRPRGRSVARVPDRTIIVDHRTEQPSVGSGDMLKRIYRNENASLVRPPRSFEPDRQRQPLRWLSTVLKQEFPGGLEVQCYFEPRESEGKNKGVVVVSSNSTKVNADLEAFLMGGRLQALLAEKAPAQPLSKHAPREQRHLAKLASRMEGVDPHPTEASTAVLEAIAAGRFRVPRHDYDSGPTPFLHAERRIKDYVRDAFDAPLELDRLAGTMRPCGNCADELDAGPERPRGPFFMSKASRPGVTGKEDIERNVRERRGTSVTMARGGRLTFKHDSDSDSDIDG
ncbi:hypothetical protein ACAN107058_20995 [Paracidovorax anthurii]|uniref:Uncharacterized protein n=2 Tax=Paracidovorax anthurii TaxID=78229 RepID=A0A328ZVC2_9BURK|nr:hypothetical protein AX018_1002127 [Paracidovorax anthurii]